MGKDFSNWAKAQIKRAGLAEGADFVVVAQKGVNPKGGRPCDEYHLTIEAAKNIAMLSGTAKGKEVDPPSSAVHQIVSEDQALRIDMAMHQFKPSNGYALRGDAHALRLQIERQGVIGGAL